MDSLPFTDLFGGDTVWLLRFPEYTELAMPSKYLLADSVVDGCHDTGVVGTVFLFALWGT